MKHPLMTFCFCVSLTITLFSAGCGDSPAEPPKQSDTEWKEVVQFRDVDIRYMVVHKGVLYVSALKPPTNNQPSTYALMKTENGEDWETIKTFDRWIGPIAFHGDTLTLWESGQMWKYHFTIGWISFWKHDLSAYWARDMVWVHNLLLAVDNTYIMVYENGIGRERNDIPNIPVVSKFINHTINGQEFAITRPYLAYKDNIYTFDGTSFEVLMNGILPEENVRPNFPSMFVNNDTLYAGFNTPSRIKRFVNGKWENFTDTIPNTLYAQDFSPALINRASSVVFSYNRFFIGTEWTGILEWTSNGWINRSSGLPIAFPHFPHYKMHLPVVQLVALHNFLFVGYGEPLYAPIDGARGLYRYKIPYL